MSTYVLLSRSTIFVHNFLFKSFKLVSVFVLLLTTCKFITLSLTDWHRGTVSHFALSSSLTEIEFCLHGVLLRGVFPQHENNNNFICVI